MIIEYKTHELAIAGNGRKYKVFNVYENEKHYVLKGEVYAGSLPQCKAFVDGYLHAQD